MDFNFNPVRKYRTCIHCREYFDSASASERVCSSCRRKHNGLLNKYRGSIVEVISNNIMEDHMKSVDAAISSVVSNADIDKFLKGVDMDDSAVYKALASDNRKEAKLITEGDHTKTSAADLFKSALKEVLSNAEKEKEVHEYYL